jgi:hypothetical protein
MAYAPYEPDLEAWKNHFINYAPSKPKKFYTVKSAQKGEEKMAGIPIKLISPTEQFVEQAKAQLATQKNETESDKTEKEKSQEMYDKVNKIHVWQQYSNNGRG